MQVKLKEAQSRLETILPVNKNVLNSIHNKIGTELQESTSGFLLGYINKTGERVDFERIIKYLFLKYDGMAKGLLRKYF